MSLADATMLREVIATVGGRRVVALDTISHTKPEDAGAVLISGSHGGVSSGEFAARHGPAIVFFNDAGIGKDEAGVAGLTLLERQGIAAGAVSHDTAVIGLALETWRGTISTLNAPARAAGFAPGEVLADAVTRVCEAGA